MPPPSFFIGGNMKLNELRGRVRDLGFTDDAEMVDNKNLTYSSINNALATINKNIECVKDIYSFTQDGTETGLSRIDMRTATVDNDGNITFSAFCDTPTIEQDEDIQNFSNYDTELDSIIVIKKSIAGTFRFPYKKRVPIVDSTWSENEDLPISYNVEHMLPLLSAYYNWLDDDIDIATRWYNEYDNLKNDYASKHQTDIPKARVRTDLWGR